MADFDVLGSAVGLYKAILQTSKPVHICLDKENNLSKELIKTLCENIADATNLTIKPMYHLLPMDVHKSEDMSGLYAIGTSMQ